MPLDLSTSNAPARNNAFVAVPTNKIRRAVFDLSHEKKMTFDFGQLIPALCIECMPGDAMDMQIQMIIRFQAMLSPPLHEVWAEYYCMFNPSRLLWPKVDASGNNWETYITGGVSGTNAAVLPRWDVSSGKHDIGSLWDYFGLPTWSAAQKFSVSYPDAVIPMDLPKRAYNFGWNEWFRDETLQNEVDITLNEDVLNSGWQKDFYTSALTAQQRGIAPALPIAGTVHAIWPSAAFTTGGPTSVDSWVAEYANAVTPQLFAAHANGTTNQKAFLERNSIDLSTATTYNIADFRLAAVLQQFMEKNARQGVRYTEFLQGIYDVDPEDYRLQRPEFVGSARVPVVFSEVLQTSSVSGAPTPQGNMAGHGLTVGRQHVGKYVAKEHGYLIGYLRVMPVPAYQQGIPKMWSRVSRYDWGIPDFANLAEQPVMNQELYLAADGVNQTTFGWQGRFNEYRYERNSVHGLFRTDLSYWHLGRIFGSRPALNASFISVTDSERTSLKRVAAVPSQPLLLGSIGHVIKALRPLPDFPDPGIFKV